VAQPTNVGHRGTTQKQDGVSQLEAKKRFVGSGKHEQNSCIWAEVSSTMFGAKYDGHYEHGCMTHQDMIFIFILKYYIGNIQLHFPFKTKV
jgi:hypothetical protein